MADNSFSKPIDEVLLMLSVLKRLGAGSMTTLNERIRSQKIQYFAQLFGVSPRYNYGLYIHGPYSPDLAKDLFKSEQMLNLATTEKFASDDVENRFIALKNFVDKYETRVLEIVSTFHWLTTAGYSQEKALQELIKLKSPTAVEIKKMQELLGDLPKC